MLRSTYLILLAACGTLPHITPAPRDGAAQHATVVKVTSNCEQPTNLADYSFYESKTATGVVVSGKHVITAAHVVRCAQIPSVRITFADGEEMPMWVERDDAMFGDGKDLSRLVVKGAYDRISTVPPPKLGYADPGDVACIQFADRPSACGRVLHKHRLDIATRPGDSGAPVYVGEILVGVVTHGNGHTTVYLPADVSWLEGT